MLSDLRINFVGKSSAVVFGAALVLGLGGCASEVRYRSSGPVVGEGGSAAELVFPGPEVTAVVAATGSGVAWPEFSRRDPALNARGGGSPYPLDSWPEASRASLDDARRITLPSSASSVVYFRSLPSQTYSPEVWGRDWRSR